MGPPADDFHELERQDLVLSISHFYLGWVCFYLGSRIDSSLQWNFILSHAMCIDE